MDYVVFDLDGTLTDSSEGLLNAFRYTIEKAGLGTPTDEQLFTFIGPPVMDTFQEVYEMTYEDACYWTNVFREEYSMNRLFENRPYEGIYETLEQLQECGCVIGMATAKPEVYAHQILEYFDLARFIQYPYGASLDHITLTKKADILRLALAAAEKDHTITNRYMVGDRKYDILGAKENNIASIGVTYGFGSRKELEIAEATYIVDTPQAIIDVVLANR